MRGACAQRRALSGAHMAPPGGHGDPGASVPYNVYNQPLDPSNQMPVTPNQLPWPGQHKPLSTERAVSNIPKGGTGGRGTWVFPSSQMFFNALQRKGKGDDVVEEDMEHIISVHNSASHLVGRPCRSCGLSGCAARRHERDDLAAGAALGAPAPRRVRHAQPAALPGQARRPEPARALALPHGRCVRSSCCASPAALTRARAGALPFDRHDWYVDRGGKQVRYIIDFYFDETRAGSPDAFVVDARPALDDLGSLRDRAKMGVRASHCALALLALTARRAGVRVVPAAGPAVPVQCCADAAREEAGLSV